MSNHTHLLAHAMKALMEETNGIIKENQAEKAQTTIQACAITAAASGVGASIFPGMGGLVMTAVAVGAVWVMYAKINKDLGISIKDNVLKSLASAVLSNILANAGALLLAFVAAAIIGFIPGLNFLVAPAQAMIAYLAVFAAAIIYINLLRKLFKANGAFVLTEDEGAKMAKEIVEETDMNAMFKEIKKSYDDNKDEIKKAKDSGAK